VKKKYNLIILLIAVLQFAASSDVFSQPVKKITKVSTSYTSVAGNTSYSDVTIMAMAGGFYNYKFGTASGMWTTQMQKITRFETNTGECYERVPTLHTVRIRRVDNAFVTGNTTVLWMESDTTTGNLNIRTSYEENMETAFSLGYYNWGTDNLFDNIQAGTNNNNIERFDVIFTAGYTIADRNNEGFAIFERGVSGGHDPVKISGITGLNGLGDPNGYKDLPLSITTADWGDIPNSSVQHVVLRKEPSFIRLLATGVKPQDRGGIFVSFASLGFTNGETIYGYSLMAPDVNITAPAQIVNYNNGTRFPLTTVEPGGGIDLIGDVDLFRLNVNCVLPVTFSFIDAVKTQNGVSVLWQTLTEKDNAKFEVEHSVDGIKFAKIGVVYPKPSVYGTGNYSYLHDLPVKGINYYRIKQVDTDGKFSYTKVVTVSITQTTEGKVSVYPNPIIQSKDTPLKLKVAVAGEYFLQLINNNGQVAFSQTITTHDGVLTPAISVARLIPGFYSLLLRNIHNGEVLSSKLMVQ
jgi:hypothetical protein